MNRQILAVVLLATRSLPTQAVDCAYVEKISVDEAGKLEYSCAQTICGRSNASALFQNCDEKWPPQTCEGPTKVTRALRFENSLLFATCCDFNDLLEADSIDAVILGPGEHFIGGELMNKGRTSFDVVKEVQLFAHYNQRPQFALFIYRINCPNSSEIASNHEQLKIAEPAVKPPNITEPVMRALSIEPKTRLSSKNFAKYYGPQDNHEQTHNQISFVKKPLKTGDLFVPLAEAEEYDRRILPETREKARFITSTKILSAATWDSFKQQKPSKDHQTILREDIVEGDEENEEEEVEKRPSFAASQNRIPIRTISTSNISRFHEAAYDGARQIIPPPDARAGNFIQTPLNQTDQKPGENYPILKQVHVNHEVPQQTPNYATLNQAPYIPPIFYHPFMMPMPMQLQFGQIPSSNAITSAPCSIGSQCAPDVSTPPPPPVEPIPCMSPECLECFSEDATVQTPEGKKTMRDLQIGDLVLARDGQMTEFLPVIMFLHRLEEKWANFYRIQTVIHSLKITTWHLLYISDCNSDVTKLTLRPAREVRVNDCLVAFDAQKKPQRFPVTNISLIRERGIYAPLTSSGNIFVNDILVSCHNNLEMPRLQDTFFGLLEFLQRIVGRHSTSNIVSNEQLPVAVDIFAHLIGAIFPSN